MLRDFFALLIYAYEATKSWSLGIFSSKGADSDKEGISHTGPKKFRYQMREKKLAMLDIEKYDPNKFWKIIYDGSCQDVLSNIQDEVKKDPNWLVAKTGEFDHFNYQILDSKCKERMTEEQYQCFQQAVTDSKRTL